ncbi:MAG: sulfur carrier protein ThiS adenylyltransferase ThiF [Bacillota bacterium]
MAVYINERYFEMEKETTAFDVRERVKPDADIIVLNGFIIKEDVPLKDGDKITLIQRGKVPDQGELEALLTARHTPGVFEKVKKACVGIAGLGGLGSNVALSLARLGIGKLILADYDVVEPSNLNRQQYFVRHIGMYKTEALKELLMEVNPFVEIVTENVYLTSQNIADCFQGVDVMVEAFDDPKCKAELVNTWLKTYPQKSIVAASGMAGYFSNNEIITWKIKEHFYLVGDSTSEAKPGCGLMAPRVAIAANHQANMVLRLILGEKDV